ncbi:zinc finger protein 432 [Ceratitis capitata]|uniref:Zinc finger protein 41 n=1 Tax=Ceratitis capitata TaxID=7213 RepID=W8BY06_CERCA|nr:zinc finger protein 432 [Ceratitis capitata]
MMQKGKKLRVSQTDKTNAIHKLPAREQTRGGKHHISNKPTKTPAGEKCLPQRKKKRQMNVEEDDLEEQQPVITKSCIICGSSEEIVDLSTNPIMKKTMASYLEDGSVDLDDCLSSLCITCVFKSRAVREVQNNIKVRLQSISNSQTTKMSNTRMENRVNSEILISTEKQKIKHFQTRSNTICDLPQSTSKSNRRVGRNKISSHPPPEFSVIESSELNISQSFEKITYKTHSKCLGVNHLLDNSIEETDNKNTVYLANYRLAEISEIPSMEYIAESNTDYNHVVDKSMLSAERMELLELPNILEIPSSCSNSTYSQAGINHSMLQVIRERSESVLITESGGKINNYKRDMRQNTLRQCRYCANTFSRKDHYNKHVRRCRNITARSLPSATANNMVCSDSSNAKRNRINLLSKSVTPITLEPPKRTRQFHCTECQATMDSISKLKIHRATHLREYQCDMCNKKFNTLHEHDFHRIVCLAKQEVWQEQDFDKEHVELNDCDKSMVRSQRSTAKTITSRRVTRAQSRARTDVNTKNPITSRRSTALTSVSRYINHNADCEESDNDTCYTNKDYEDDISVADSMDLGRRVYTDNWLESRHYSEVRDQPMIEINSKKEYDLYLLEKLKSQIRAQEFACLAENCGFFTDTLLNLMLHDYVHHFKSSWFYCPKCGSVFTSKVFLDYHLDRQNGGRFICYKCNEQFMFQHQLDMHLISHEKQLNHTCDKCKCEFLTEEKLFQHMKLEHNNESEKNIICIQSKATFASARTADEDKYINGKPHRKYTVRILDMQLPYVPSKRPLELPGHKPYRRRIGIIEFENDRNPNCCSCK